MPVQSTADVVVVGVGTCGEDLSLRLLDAGLEVVGIESALVGGECAYWACLPSKRMIRMATLLAESRRANGRGGRVDAAPVWDLVARQVRNEVTGGWDDTVAAQRFGQRGGHLVRGRARLVGPDTVSVDDQEIRARRGIVIATGSTPAIPPIPGLGNFDYWTTHDVIQLATLPDSLIVLGGGAVACELGQVLARYGVHVTLVEAADRLLPAEEPEASHAVTTALKTDGISVYTGSGANRVVATEDSFAVTLADGYRLEASRLLVATGRRAQLADLGLETVGIDAGERFIAVDERMRAGDGIWAMGDVTGKGMLTHVALYQSAIAAADILGLSHPPARYDAVPRVTFTDPEVGSVGLTESAATAAGLNVAVVVKQLPATFRGWLHATGNEGVVKLVVDKGTGLLVGATTVGPHGGELLGLLGLAVHARVPLSDLRSMIYAFPTFYGAVGEAIGAYGRGLTTVLDPGYDALTRLDEVSGVAETC